MKLFTCFLQPFAALWRYRNWNKESQRQDGLNAQTADTNTSSRSLLNRNYSTFAETNESTPSIAIVTANPSEFVLSVDDPVAPANDGHLTTTHSFNRGSVDSHSHRSLRDSASNRSHTRSRSNSSNGEDTLARRLRHARIEWPPFSRNWFVPMQAQQSLITPAIVQLEIESTGLPAPEASKNATKTCKDAKQLFATLAYIEKASTICSFLEEGISDDDLPLSRTNSDEGSMLLKRTSGEPVEAFTGWDDEDMEDFDRIQWWMKAPIFEESEHKDLLSGNILPFIPLPSDEDVGESKQGGYSEVYAVRVHPAHHNFWESSSSEKEEPLIAVKRLNSPDVKEFEKEREILTKLGARDHPHLIKLLATYHLDKRYHLMFPYANANLRKYWDDNPLPWFNKETLLWSVKQMTGIASGLVVIHNYRATIPLGVAGGFRKQKDAELRVREGEELFGRHGDIKPENILWFKHMHGVEDKMGVLQIADFGLGRFHGRESRSRVDPRTVQTSPTYEPPECKLRRSVSRAYDIWSLGCLYLEFVTWLLKGSAEIGSFSNVRGKTSSLGINEDNFFNTIHGGLDAEVREEVIEWVKELHQHPKCSSLLHELLDLVMNKMLVVDARSRIKAGILHERLIMMTKASEKDEKYLLDPVPLPPHRQEHDKTRSQSTSAVPGLQQPMEKRNIVTFSRDTTIIGPPVSPVQMDTRPRDLVLRSAGTPAYRLTPCKTWPTISPLESVGGPASSSSDANEE